MEVTPPATTRALATASAGASAAPNTVQHNVVSVFGAAWAKPGSDLYKEAELVGKLLAEAGFAVRNGGYGGTMEAVSKGVAAGGGHSTGYTVEDTFLKLHGPNEHLTAVVDMPNLVRRIEAMTVGVEVFVALNGTLGTLTELAVAWNHAFLSDMGDYRQPLILAYEHPWRKVVEECGSALGLPAEMLQLVTFVNSAEEVLARVEAYAATQDV